MIHKAGFVDPGQLTFSHGGVRARHQRIHPPTTDQGDQEHDYNHSQPQRSAVTKGWAESEIVFQGHRLLRQYVQGFQVPGL